MPVRRWDDHFGARRSVSLHPLTRRFAGRILRRSAFLFSAQRRALSLALKLRPRPGPSVGGSSPRRIAATGLTILPLPRAATAPSRKTAILKRFVHTFAASKPRSGWGLEARYIRPVVVIEQFRRLSQVNAVSGHSIKHRELSGWPRQPTFRGPY